MKLTHFDFGFFEHYDEKILVIVINEGTVIDGDLSRTLVGLIDEALDTPSVLLIDRRNEYSYSGSGLLTLKESNIANVLATGIIAYPTLAEREAGREVNVRNTRGRSNLNVFSSLEDAMSWASQQLQK